MMEEVKKYKHADSIYIFLNQICGKSINMWVPTSLGGIPKNKDF